MPRPKTDSQRKKLCSGCYNNRYNYKGTCERPGIDAPVTSNKCWSLDPENVLYCRGANKWVMSCHSGNYQKFLTEWARTGKKPTWRYW